ncbi:MAG: ComF family protein [Rhodospirillales bacterium]
MPLWPASLSFHQIAMVAPGLFRRGLDLLLPPRCASCGGLIDGAHLLCITCWRSIRQIAPPLCASCGFPFDFDAGADARCADCLAEPPAYHQARAALVYDDASRPAILSFKHGDRTDSVFTLARLMMQAGREQIMAADLLVPVPLHHRRLFIRRYNQSALLAQAIGRLMSRPVLLDALHRHRATASQGRLGRRQRQRNVAGAISVPDTRRGAVAGKRILLIDDVMTTGATVSVCARALRRGGACQVDVLTIARVVRLSGGS